MGMSRRTRDFSLIKFKELCQSIVKANYQSITIQQYLEDKKEKERIPDKIVLLRHDVDRIPNLALKFAEIETGLGLQGTYYFRTHSASFKPSLIRKIYHLGHEIGYHYETLSDAGGDIDLALDLFTENLTCLREIVPIETIAMHGRPLSPWDNRQIWNHASFEKFNLLGEAYLSLDFNEIDYFSDTGRTWHPSRHNIKDKAQNAPRYFLESTDDLIKHINSGRSNHLCILTHPERWPSQTFHWILQSGIDFSLNLIKDFYSFLQRR